jgi:hypothetical protein
MEVQVTRCRQTASRVAVLLACACTCWLQSCLSLRSENNPARPVAEGHIADPPRHAGAPLIFIAMPGSAPFQTTRKSMVTEFGKSFDVSTFIVGPETSSETFRAALEQATPSCIVLMNNRTARLYRDYQRARPGTRFPPAVVVMSSYLEDMRPDLINVTGISYEVPGVTAFVGLRAIIKAPISRVGVLYVRSLESYIEKQRSLAAKEHIKVYPLEVSTQPTLREIQNAFRVLRDVHRVDALWILNDNRLLKDGRFLVDVWQPQIDLLAVPVIVGTAPLVNAQAPFGTFAVLPDHAALGVQAANLILDLADDGWQITQHPVELPLSTVNVLDVTQARQKFGLRDGALNRVDVPVE